MKSIVITFLLIAPTALGAQAISYEALLDSARARNRSLRQMEIEIEKVRQQNLPHAGIGNAQAQYSYGQLDGPDQDYQIQVQQGLGNPVAGLRQYALREAAVDNSQLALRLREAWLQRQIISQFAGWRTHWEILRTQEQLIDLFRQAREVAQRQYQAGEISRPESGFAKGRYLEAVQKRNETQAQMLQFRLQLEALTALDLSNFQPAPLEQGGLASPAGQPSSVYQEYYRSEVALAEAQHRQRGAQYFPEIFVGYTNQQLNLVPGYDIFTIGARLPLLDVGSHQGRKMAALELEQKKLEQEQQDQLRERNIARLRQLQQQLLVDLSEGAVSREELEADLKRLQQRYQGGEIDILELSLSLDALSAAFINYQKLQRQWYDVLAQLHYLQAP